MQLFLSLLLFLAGVFLLLAIALYVIPARITGSFRASGDEILLSAALSWCGISLAFSWTGVEPVVSVRWLRWEIIRKPLGGRTSPPAAADKDQPSPAPRPLPPGLFRLILIVAGSLSFSRFRGHLLLGLPSPAGTGRLFGYWTALRYTIPEDDRISFVLTPAFDRQVLEGEGELVLLLHHPLRLILVTLAVLAGPRIRAVHIPLRAARSPA